MDAITERSGRFTSSRIGALCKTGRGKFGFGAPALTYIEETRIERKMGCSIDVGGAGLAGSWGNIMEIYCFDQLPTEYKLVSGDTIVHPDEKFKDFWSGSADLIVPDKKIAEIKCYYRKNFALYTEALLSEDIEFIRKNFHNEYWQMVSNAILNEVDFAEGISFMPMRSEIPIIKDWVSNLDEDTQWKYKFIFDKPEDELNWLPDGSGYKSINKFEFKVPQEDIDFLHERVETAIKMLK